MGSTRLPGKVLADIGGATMLGRVVARARRAATLDEIVVATSTLPEDEMVAREAARLGAPVFRGDEQDVLDRYYRAAREFGADVIVRITADCPLTEPEVIDRVGEEFARGGGDYASNSILPTYPRGLDVEVMTAAALSRAWREATRPYERSHVTPYIYKHPEVFRLLPVSCPEGDYSDHRWTVDTPEDLAFVREVYGCLGGSDNLSWREVLDLLARRPELAEMNRHVRQKALEEG